MITPRTKIVFCMAIGMAFLLLGCTWWPLKQAQPPVIGAVETTDSRSAPPNSDALAVTPKPTSHPVDPGNINCDCDNINAGLLTSEFYKQCKSAEDDLKKKASEDSLKLQADANGKLVSGDFCDSVASGPSPWPSQGADQTPPAPKGGGKPCEKTSGIARNCVE